MQKSNYKEAIDKVFVDVIQEMAFMDVVPFEDEVKDFSNTISFKINILMPCIGDVIITIPEKEAAKIATDLKLSEHGSHLDDILGEIINVLVGRIFSEIAPSCLFELGLPRKVDIETLDRTKMVQQNFLTTSELNLSLFHHYHKFETN